MSSTSRERVKAVMEGRTPDRPAVSVYISWPEYGWRFTGHSIWEAVLGRIDGMAAMDCMLKRHPTDFASGPIGAWGSGWLDGKTLEREDADFAFFRETAGGRRWRFDRRSHVLVEVGADGDVRDHAQHPGDSRAALKPPGTIAEAEDWFRQGPGAVSEGAAPAPDFEPAYARWGGRYFMTTCTVGPYVAVGYALGFEPALTLLAENPRVYARLMELYLGQFRSHYEKAAQVGYDGGHMVESWCSADLIAPSVYRNWVAPLHREAARMIQACGLKADLYSPGWFMPMLDAVREQGWDAIRIDDQCRGVDQDIGEARRLLGPDQCLFGNMSSYSLWRGDWDEIKARTRSQFDAAGRGAPFIISTGSGLCDETDPAVVDRWLAYAIEVAGRS